GKAIALLHAEHHRNATAAERLVDKATAMVSRPAFIALAAGVVAFWGALNLMLPLWGRHPFDAAPFPWLMDGVAIVALLIASLIVTTQRRANKLADLREQMTLEL